MLSVSLLVLVVIAGLSGVESNIADYDCFERADVGPGRAFFQLYAWDPRTKTCNKFIYGGLWGNRNRFETIEQCTRACHDAVLRKQLDFEPARRYTAVNRLHHSFRLPLSFEQVEQNYFKLVTQPSGQVLSVTQKNNITITVEQDFNGTKAQLWDVVPTGEKDYFRIKTAARPAGHADYLFLQVSSQDASPLTLGRRDTAELGQQWRLV